MNFYNFVTLASTVIRGGDSDAAPAVTEATSQVAENAGLLGQPQFFSTILIYLALPLALYFFMFRPQRKREKEIKDMQASIGVGDNVLTSSGMYGVVTAVGEDCFIVEFGTNKGIRIPIRKMDILAIKTPNITPSSSKDNE